MLVATQLESSAKVDRSCHRNRSNKHNYSLVRYPATINENIKCLDVLSLLFATLSI